MKKLRICFTGGATGGHFFPLLFVLRELKKIEKEKNAKFEYYYIGVKPMDEKLLKEEGVKIYKIGEVKLRRYFDFQNFLDFLNTPLVFLQSLFYVFITMPDVLFSKGGPSSFFVVLAAWIFRIPILIHDSDSIPGLANKISSFFAKKIALAFDEARNFFPKEKVIVVGQPIDERIIFNPIFKEDYERFDLNSDEKIILVFGGSQGSEFLNDLIVEILPELLNIAQIVHLTGQNLYKDTYLYALSKIRQKNPLKEKKYKAFPFLKNEDFLILMKMADLIISRAGSSSIFEIAALGKPSILIPLSKSIVGDHQKRNAFIYSQYGACLFLDEPNAKPHLLLNIIRDLFNRPQYLEEMSKNAKNFYKPGAAYKLAEELLFLAQWT
ncbi:MAG: hypothetical protein C4347_00290 [Patescibacteria group bacterium]